MITKEASLDYCIACYIFSSRDWTLFNEPSIFTARELSDEETRSHVVFREILNTPPIQSKNPKIAFLFLPPGTLHFEPLWDKFFCGHEDRFSVYVHASREKPVHTSHYFIGRDIHRETVGGTNHFKHFVRFSSAKKRKRKRNFQRMGGHVQFWLKLRRMLFGKVHRIHRFQYFNPRVDCGS
ncbi:hypothetical protein V6Z12_D04G000900 [Gossypium hirsutum]